MNGLFCIVLKKIHKKIYFIFAHVNLFLIDSDH
jgi:hypothetical protein